MLEYLHVKNLALIREAELFLSDGLNVLLGETGAGKSVLLGSVGLALGARADRSLIRTNAPYALIELRFRVDAPETIESLRALGIEPEEGEIIISRKILPDRSFSRLQGEIVNTSLLSKVSEHLLNVHGQHDNEMLLREERHLSILDDYAKNELREVLPEYTEAYRAYRAKKEELKALGPGDDDERNARMDFLAFEIREITDAGLVPDEEEEVRSEFRRLSDAKRIRDTLSGIEGLLSGEVSDSIQEAVRLSMGLRDYSKDLSGLSETLSGVEAVLSDGLRETRTLFDANDADEERLYLLESRLDLINSLKRKYGGSIPEILETLSGLEKEYAALERFTENKERCEEELRALQKQLVHAGKRLHEAREQEADRFSREMAEALRGLNFLDVRFRAEVTLTTHYSQDGADSVRFLIATNPGEDLKPLSKVASGGELSRIMLAIRTIISDSDHVDTLIFDEIDTGISGKTGAMVAIKLREIARYRQVLCVTHLPQIAAAADHHFLIEKSAQDGGTETDIRPLDEESAERVLAGLLGGEVTSASLKNAKELKERMRQGSGE
ncbi:MAG: DNA repair protein RecN [Lachnospiraceae bacterium]|nr:DNA repair protein RecN [Lachnospiraceae bacterium]